jgi:ribosomal protein S18 acetylase RimI-like enzyme
MELKAKSAFCGGIYEEMGQVFISGNSRVPDAHFNRISIIDGQEFNQRVLKESLSALGEVPLFVDTVHPTPAPLRDLLGKNCFHSTGELRASMVMKEPTTIGGALEGLEIQAVRAETLDVFLELFLQGFDTPQDILPFAKELFHGLVLERFKDESLRMYLGIVNGEPASTQYLFYERDEGGINMVSTKASLRRKGLATAMLCCLLDDAGRLGVRCLSLEARANSDPERLYQKLGFATIATHEIFTNMLNLRYGL